MTGRNKRIDNFPKEIGFDECFKILAVHFFGEFSKVITDYEIIKLPKKSDVLVVETEKPITHYVRIFDYFKKYNIIEFKSANDPFRIDKDIPKIMVYCGGILINEKKATVENTTFTVVSARKPVKLFRLYNKSIQKIKNGVYLIHNIVQVPVYIVVANEIQGQLDRELAFIKEFSTGKERTAFITSILHEVLSENQYFSENLHFAFSLYRNEINTIMEKKGVSMSIGMKNIEAWNEQLGLKDKYRKEVKIETAIKMKEEGLDILLIARITGLSPEKIEEL